MYKDIVFYVDEIKDKGKNVQRINYVRVYGLVIPFATIEEKKKLKNENGELFEELVDEWQKVLSGKVEPQVIKPEKITDEEEGSYYNLHLRYNSQPGCELVRDYYDDYSHQIIHYNMFRLSKTKKNVYIYGQYKDGKMVDVITGQVVVNGENDRFPLFILNYSKKEKVSKKEVINNISKLSEDDFDEYRKIMKNEVDKLYAERLNRIKINQEEQRVKQREMKVKRLMEEDFDGYIAKIRKRNK